MNPYIVGALIVTHIAAVSVGWYKRGESEAEAVTKAYQLAVKESASEWQTKLDSAIINAKKEALVKAKSKVVIKKVIEYVKTKPSNPVCYDDTSLQFVSEAIRSSRN